MPGAHQEGDVDAATAPAIERRLLPAIVDQVDGFAGQIVLDCSGVTYIDSTLTTLV